MTLWSKDCRFEIFKEGCAAMDSGDYEEAARQFWILFSEMDRLVKIDRIKKDCFGAETRFAEEQDCYALKHAFPRRELIKVLKNSVKK